MNRPLPLLQNPLVRVPLMALAMLSLVAALNAGLIRLGWGMPSVIEDMGALHGPLMVCGFLGTMIGLERAVALGKPWGYMSPLSSALGVLVLFSGLAVQPGALLFTLGSVVMLAIFVVIVRHQPALFTWTMMLGAAGWLVGNLLWLAGVPFAQITVWWTTFLVLTIVGERLELSRLMRPSRTSQRIFLGAVALFLAGALASTVEWFLGGGFMLGKRAMGLGMVALAVWLLHEDIARRTVRQTGLTRYIAWCLLLGYVWLAIGGALWMVYAGVSAGAYYDAMLHAVYVGFVMSMIFGHMSIILPAVLGRAVAYTRWMYAPLILLQLSLALRLAGDLVFGLTVRQWGGMLNAIAILLFIIMTVRAILVPTLARRQATARQLDPSPAPTVNRAADDPAGQHVSRRAD